MSRSLLFVLLAGKTLLLSGGPGGPRRAGNKSYNSGVTIWRLMSKQREPITLKESERCSEGRREAGHMETLQVAMLASADQHPESRKPLLSTVLPTSQPRHSSPQGSKVSKP